MLLKKNMRLKSCLIFAFAAQIISNNNDNFFERNKMNDNNWLTYAREFINKSGTVDAKSNGSDININWHISDIFSKYLADFKAEVSNFAAKATAKSEVEFLKTFPEAVTQEMFLKPAAKFFEHGIENVDWQAVQEQIEKTVEQFYLTDINSFGPQVAQMLKDDIYFYAVAKNGDGNILGFIMLAITPALKFGQLKMINLSVDSGHQKQNIDQAFLELVFQIFPKAESIFTAQRVTSKENIARLKSLGFAEDANVVVDPNHKLDLKYFVVLAYQKK